MQCAACCPIDWPPGQLMALDRVFGKLLPVLVIIYIVPKETSRTRWKTLND